MSELLDRAKQSLSDHQWAKSCRVESLYPEQLVRELIAEVERLQAESAHWKALWQGTVDYSTKMIQERDDALREVERLEAEIEGLEGMVNTMGGCLNSVAEADKLRRYR
ncbi:Uncharacterised protein [Mycobacteroides abscessus subsp. abscessus]|uniref:hypothetical protein n=1 Tax=Mycobacteroides abscessus TaxID=36809 RepID=UPI0009295A9F|nr:hypothetical protein [Mycobacteroides abscessus]SII79596.1 Uncharacterised protein [Mycobacteroides abscessus subsp. abscessus]SII85116.1 Uncharacterised protein [Mycobacteroides abscessus subsp. abscessus]SIL59779.1 Uncharacterised protein [Mycobacteroides abscessus subsp. abscessus]